MLQAPVQGTHKSCTLHVEGGSTNGQWRYQRIELVIDGQHTGLNTTDHR